MFSTVPRLLEKVFERIMAKGASLKGIKRSLFFWAVNLGKRYDNNRKQGLWYSIQLSLANKLIFNKWREALGNNLKYVITVALPVRKTFTHFQQLPVFRFRRLWTYRNSPVISVNRGSWTNRLGTVGPVINGVELN